VLLTQAIVNEGMMRVAAGLDPMSMKRGLDKAVAAAVLEIGRQSRPCSSPEQMARVAAISANGDVEIGDMIAAGYLGVGERGVITIEPGKGISTKLEMVEGLQFESGYISPSFVNDRKRQKCVLKDACVLVCDKVISTGREILPILDAVAKSKRSLLVIAEDVVGDALSTLAINSVRGTLRAC